MADIIFCGVEGGGSVSSLVLYNGLGQILAETNGLGTNYWIVSMAEARSRIIGMVNEAKKKAGLPQETKIKSMCLSLSGAEEMKSRKEFKDGIFQEYPGLCENIVVCSDTAGPIAAVHEDGGAVIIAGTGSNALLVNPDGSKVRCGGWGHMLGDEGSAYWIAHRALKIFFDDEDLLQEAPEGYSTKVLWQTIRDFFNVQTRFELIPHLYKIFTKNSFAKLCKDLAEKAFEGDPLCKWIFREAGQHLANHLIAVSRGASNALMSSEHGLPVVCVGSVWKSWDLLKGGFIDRIKSSKIGPDKFSLLVLVKPAATGAVYIAAKSVNYKLPNDYSANYRVFYFFCRN